MLIYFSRNAFEILSIIGLLVSPIGLLIVYKGQAKPVRWASSSKH